MQDPQLSWLRMPLINQTLHPIAIWLKSISQGIHGYNRKVDMQTVEDVCFYSIKCEDRKLASRLLTCCSHDSKIADFPTWLSSCVVPNFGCGCGGS
jgi:hypothetical protein